MLWKLSVGMFEKLVAGIGAIITIIAMVLDPFFQQVITIEFKPSRVGDVFISSTEFVIDPACTRSSRSMKKHLMV
jgi:hypothetical protein